jgi:vacuolar-type H+-ATPase subunit I/STV1
MTRRQKRDLKNIVVNILSYITIMIIVLAGLFVAYMAIDIAGFMAWAMSGQVPEGFYLGEVTFKVLSNIIVK